MVKVPRSSRRRNPFANLGQRLRPRRRLAKTTGARTSGTLALTQLVKKIILGKSETKYIASQASNVAITSKSIVTPTSWNYAVPNVTAGVGSFQRIGEKISNVMGRTIFSFTLDQGSALSQDLFVRIYYGINRSARNVTTFGALPAGSLLDNGDGTSKDWVPLSGINALQLAQQPVQKEAWQLRQKTFKFLKNPGTLNNEAVLTSPNINYDTRTWSWMWKHKGNVLYQTGGINPNSPTNYCPVYAIVAWYADGTTAAIANIPVYSTVRNEMHFHDV